MALLLAIDTTADVCNVAIGDGDGVVASISLRGNKGHSRVLQPMICQMLELSGFAAEQVEGITVSAGPGSFTGIRIGMTAAKALAQVWRVPVFPQSTLQAMAVAAGNQEDCMICPVIDARHGRVFAAAYQDGVSILADRLVDAHAFVQELSDRGIVSCKFVGDGAALCEAVFKEIVGSNAKAEINQKPNLLTGLFALGSRQLDEKAGISYEDARPVYLVQSEPERRRRTMLGSSGNNGK